MLNSSCPLVFEDELLSLLGPIRQRLSVDSLRASTEGLIHVSLDIWVWNADSGIVSVVTKDEAALG